MGGYDCFKNFFWNSYPKIDSAHEDWPRMQIEESKMEYEVNGCTVDSYVSVYLQYKCGKLRLEFPVLRPWLRLVSIDSVLTTVHALQILRKWQKTLLAPSELYKCTCHWLTDTLSIYFCWGVATIFQGILLYTGNT